ncbi:MAG: acetate/propionate family kinase [Nitrospirae bacterium]|nr:acetate/propionate family kinase [Nitrospirota bacterium]
MKDLIRFLSGVEVFSDLSEEWLKRLWQASEIVEYKPSQYVMRAGEIGRYLWIVYNGKLEVTCSEEDDSCVILYNLYRGDVFGEISVVTGEPAIADIVAVQEASVIKLPREVFSLVMLQNLSTLTKFASLITERFTIREQNTQFRQRQRSLFVYNSDPYDLNFSSVKEPLKLLVINCGSSSLKYSLFDTSRSEPMFEGLVENIGAANSIHKIKAINGKVQRPDVVKDIAAAFSAMVDALTDTVIGVITDFSEIQAVGHRVVHGGNRFSGSVVITKEVKEAIMGCAALAPLHNPYNMAGIQEMERLLPNAVSVAVFDTAFHQTMPQKAYNYALPYELSKERYIRRYGFHGTNHHFVAMMASVYLRRPVDGLKIISCHLGNGASICAIDHGRSLDTTMGLTPLEGLVMGTRCGDIDPGLVLYLLQNGLGVDKLDKILNKESGLKGVSGLSNDMREILAAAEVGNVKAERALSSFCYRAKKYIGSYIAALGGLDVLLFTGGIGENSAEIRARICQGLDNLGIILDVEVNRSARVQRGCISDISQEGSSVKILVVAADEERMIAREIIHAVNRSKTSEDIKGHIQNEIPITISTHHVHLSERDYNTLLGAEGQIGQAVCQSVDLIGPKGKLEAVRLARGFRDETQVEISRTEEFRLGVDAPIRNSGDIEGTPGIILRSDSRQLKLDKGVICVRRHVHMSPEDAMRFGLRDRDVIRVRVAGDREVVFGDCLVMVSPKYRLEMHINTDEANSAEITDKTIGYLEGIQSRCYT